MTQHQSYRFAKVSKKIREKFSLARQRFNGLFRSLPADDVITHMQARTNEKKTNYCFLILTLDVHYDLMPCWAAKAPLEQVQ